MYFWRRTLLAEAFRPTVHPLKLCLDLFPCSYTMPMSKKAEEKKAKAAQKAAAQQEKALKKAALVTRLEGEAKVLEELTCWLKAHPSAASSILGSIKGGAWDEGGSDDDTSDRLPSYMNKVKCLSEAKMIEMSGWVNKLPRKVCKESLGEILGFLVHMHPSSALPTKVESKLLRDFEERFEKYGKKDASPQPAAFQKEIRTV